MDESLKAALARYHELEKYLSDPQVLADPQKVKAYAKEMASLKPLVNRLEEFDRVKHQIMTTKELLASDQTSEEMRTLALSELKELEGRLRAIEEELETHFLKKDPEEEKSVIVEIRAGTGGLEASLFAADLFRMYTRFAARESWKVESLSSSPSEAGGFKETIFAVEGEGVYRKLKFESGVHRVQRVPATEASGRIHTSTATVAVLPQAEELEVQIDPKDLRIDVFRSSGPGGQSVNTADSAVRVTHLATGLVVSCQDERSQLKNKAKAMKVLRARLLELKTKAQQAQRSQERRAQIGTGERSEKIRTYNFPDQRVTDHRIGLTSHRLEEILDGKLEELIDPLLEAQRKGDAPYRDTPRDGSL